MRTLVHLIWQKPKINQSVSQPNAAVYQENYELNMESISSPHVHAYGIAYRWCSETDKTNDFYNEQGWSLVIWSKTANTHKDYDYAQSTGQQQQKIPIWLKEFIRLGKIALPKKDQLDIECTFPAT